MADSRKKPAKSKAGAKTGAGKSAPKAPRRAVAGASAEVAGAEPAVARAAAKRPAASKATAEKAPARTPAQKRRAAAPAGAKAVAKRAPAKKAAASEPAEAKPASKKTAATKPVATKPAAKEPAARKRAARKPAATKPTAPEPAAPPSPDPEGFFVARVRGEDAVREAPHPMLESGGFDEEVAGTLPVYDEGLGDLPWAYGDDTLVALPRDPRTLFLYWDHARDTMASAFAGVEQPHAQIWLFARGAGWERVRVIDFALESRGYYVHDLEPGRVYRAEIHVVGRGGQDRLLPAASNPVALPPVGPSPVLDDRFVAIPWELPLPKLLGPGTPGGPFSEELRALLARLSDWARFQAELLGAPGAGGMGGRPSSPHGGPGGPSSPSSPFGPYGGRDA